MQHKRDFYKVSDVYEKEQELLLRSGPTRHSGSILRVKLHEVKFVEDAEDPAPWFH